MLAFGIFYAAILTFAFAAFVAAGRADLRSENELQRLVTGKGEGGEPVHTHFDTTKG